MTHALRFLTAALLLIAPVAVAGPAVVSVDPPSHAHASPGADIVIRFDAPLHPDTNLPRDIRVFGRWMGPVAGLHTLEEGGTAVRFRPIRQLFAGDWITVTVCRRLAGTDGEAITRPFTWNYWVRTLPGSLDLQLIATDAVRLPGEERIQTYGAYAGDLDADGDSDLALPNEISNDLRMFLNDGSGRFTRGELIPIPGGARPSPIEGADFNLDGRLDLAIGNTGSDKLNVLLGDGMGGFTVSQTLVSGQSVRGVAVADLDADGSHDVVTANREAGTLGFFEVVDGSVVRTAVVNTPGSKESACALADANADGILDLFVGAHATREILLLLGDGDGGFRTMDRKPVNGNPWMIAAGDLDGDGLADVVSVNSWGNSVSVLKSTGTGLTSAVNMDPGGFPLAVDLGDLDGDGDLEIVTSNWGSADWTVYENIGGDFVEHRRYPAEKAGSCAILHDVDGNGTLDMTGIDEEEDLLFFFRNAPGEGPSPTPRITAAPNPFNTSTTIRFNVAAAGRVSVDVFDLRGRRVKGLLETTRAEGPGAVVWDGRDRRGLATPGGTYWVRVADAAGTEAFRLVRLSPGP